MTNSVQLKGQIAQMVKQIGALTKTMNEKDAQISLLISKIKSMEWKNPTKWLLIRL